MNPAAVVLLLEELNLGGTQRHAPELAKHLDPLQFRSGIWLMAHGEDMVPLAYAAQIPIRRLTSKSRLGLGNLFALWRALKSHSIDILLLLTVMPNIRGRIL